MNCCVCGKDVTGLPVMRDNVTGLECCESCGWRLGGPAEFVKYVESGQWRSVIAPPGAAVPGARPAPSAVKDDPALRAALVYLGTFIMAGGLAFFTGIGTASDPWLGIAVIVVGALPPMVAASMMRKLPPGRATYGVHPKAFLVALLAGLALGFAVQLLPLQPLAGAAVLVPAYVVAWFAARAYVKRSPQL